jgi:hypothetical protein
MQRKSIILVKYPGGYQTWGNFKRACKENALPYHSLKMKKFPIEYKEYEIHKIPFNSL